ncbi:MAG TPA: hypothetical protein VKD25_06335 [Burkholderiales bacterium]|nr:hypothetical protein [Burkholderiales bacterium]
MPVTLTWWTALCAAAVLNVAAWFFSAWLLARRRSGFPPDAYALRRTLLLLSAVYVAGCAFRSVFPMVDVPRTCLHDTWVSRIFVGRMVATAAELAFSLQWVLLLKEAGVRIVPRVIVPALVAAELFSWAAVLTQNNIYHAIENSLWTLSAALAVIGVVGLWSGASERGKRVILGVVACAGAYIAFMLSYDVPMYLGRWQAGIPTNFRYLDVGDGFGQIVERCRVVLDWAAWRQDAVWLTLYFTTAVWISIALAHVPPLRANSSGQPHERLAYPHHGSFAGADGEPARREN